MILCFFMHFKCVFDVGTLKNSVFLYLAGTFPVFPMCDPTCERKSSRKLWNTQRLFGNPAYATGFVGRNGNKVTSHGVSPSLELFDADHHVQVALWILLDHVPHVVRFPRLLRDRDGIHENHCHHRRLFFSSLGAWTSTLCYYSSI